MRDHQDAERVLVTGSSGFLGRRLVPLLVEAGFDVSCVSRRASGQEPHWQSVDLLERDGIDEVLSNWEPTHLVHLAWSTEHQAFWHDPANLDWVAATLHLLRRFHHHGGQRAVLTGSCAEYDWTHPGPYTELDAGPAPTTLYGAAKLATGRAAVAYSDAADDLSVVWARLFNPYGPGEDSRRLVPQLIECARRHSQLELRSPDDEVDLMYVDDVAAGLAAILQSPLAGEVNVGSGMPHRIADVAELVAQIARLEPIASRGPDASSATRSANSVIADVTRLNTVAGLGPTRSLAEGLLEMWDATAARIKETVT